MTESDFVWLIILFFFTVMVLMELFISVSPQSIDKRPDEPEVPDDSRCPQCGSLLGADQVICGGCGKAFS